MPTSALLKHSSSVLSVIPSHKTSENRGPKVTPFPYMDLLEHAGENRRRAASPLPPNISTVFNWSLRLTPFTHPYQTDSLWVKKDQNMWTSNPLLFVLKAKLNHFLWAHQRCWWEGVTMATLCKTSVCLCTLYVRVAAAYLLMGVLGKKNSD